MTRRKQDASELLRRALELMGEPAPANDSEPVIDREAIRERARRTAEWMRKARNQG